MFEVKVGSVLWSVVGILVSSELGISSTMVVLSHGVFLVNMSGSLLPVVTH